MGNEATQQRFFAMLNQFPSVAGYWDVQEKSFRIEEAGHDFAALSSGEQVMLSFFRSVWFGKD